MYLIASSLHAQAPEAIAAKGIAQLEGGNFYGAEQEFAEALRRNPKLVEVQNLMGVALAQQGKHREARVYFLRAIALRSDYSPAHANLAINAVQSEQYQFAVNEFRTALKLDRHPANEDELRYDLALALFHVDDYEQSLEVLGHISNQGHDAGYFALTGSDNRELGHGAEAIKNLETAVQMDPHNAAFLYDLAIGLIQSGQAKKAIERLDVAIRGCGDCAELHAALGVAYYASGRSDQAASHYETAVRLQPGVADLRGALGDLYFAAGDYRKSTEEYEAASKLDPRNVSYLVKQGRNELRLQQPSKADHLFREVLSIDPNNASAYLNLGKIAVQQGSMNIAVAQLEKAVQVEPENAAAWYQLGLTYKRNGQPEKALAAMNRFRKIHNEGQ
jgi:tetratricopeptide (TPR) repeat protein